MSISKIYAMSKKGNVLSIRSLSHYKADIENGSLHYCYYISIPALANKNFSKIPKYNSIGNMISRNIIKNTSYKERKFWI